MDSSSDDNNKQSDQQFTASAKKPSKQINKSVEKKGGKGKAAKKPKDKQKKQAKDVKKKQSKSKGKSNNIEKDKQTVKQYMQKQNRPYNLLNIFDNLHGSIKKANLQSILDNLCQSGFLTCKEFGKNKIYFLNQTKFEFNEGEMEKITEQLTQSRELSSELQIKHKALMDEYRKLTSMKTSQQIVEEIANIKHQIKSIQNKKQKLLNEGSNKLSEEVVIAAQKDQQKIRKVLKKYKGIKKDAVNVWCQILEKKSIQVAEIMGIDM